MNKYTIPIVINVYRNCATCKHVQFTETLINEPEIGICEISKEIVINENISNYKTNVSNDCEKWVFDKNLLDEISHILDIENSPLDYSEK